MQTWQPERWEQPLSRQEVLQCRSVISVKYNRLYLQIPPPLTHLLHDHPAKFDGVCKRRGREPAVQTCHKLLSFNLCLWEQLKAKVKSKQMYATTIGHRRRNVNHEKKHALTHVQTHTSHGQVCRACWKLLIHWRWDYDGQWLTHTNTAIQCVFGQMGTLCVCVCVGHCQSLSKHRQQRMEGVFIQRCQQSNPELAEPQFSLRLLWVATPTAVQLSLPPPSSKMRHCIQVKKKNSW